MVTEVEWFGERLDLLAERAVWWPAKSTLLVADIHLGKDASFRRYGIPIPMGSGQNDLNRLTALLGATGARRLVFLGDLLHARSGMTDSTRDLVHGWRQRHKELTVILVRGNHDRSAGDPPPDWEIECVSEPFQDPPFLLCHAPPQGVPVSAALAGHLHPAVTLVGPANTSMSLPCFWMRSHTLVLPAFTSFAGRPEIAPEPGDRIFVIGEGQVAEVPVYSQSEKA